MASFCKKAVAQGTLIAFRFAGRYPPTSRSVYKPPVAEGEHFSGNQKLLVADLGGRLMSRLIWEHLKKLESVADDHVRSFDYLDQLLLLVESVDEEDADDDSADDFEEEEEEDHDSQPLISAMNAFLVRISALLVKSFVQDRSA